jgi:hypothetical protein
MLRLLLPNVVELLSELFLLRRLEPRELELGELEPRELELRELEPREPEPASKLKQLSCSTIPTKSLTDNL